MSTFQPGDIVTHPEKDRGIVQQRTPVDAPTELYVIHQYGVTYDFTGWERVEIVEPGHVQVRVDDLDLSGWEGRHEWNYSRYDNARLAIRVAKALAAQNRDEQPTSATVTLPCPECGELLARDVEILTGTHGRCLAWKIPIAPMHACPPAQPDEPTSFGARIQVTNHDAETTDLWVRQHDGYWANENGDLMPWDALCRIGEITLGWDDEA